MIKWFALPEFYALGVNLLNFKMLLVCHPLGINIILTLSADLSEVVLSKAWGGRKEETSLSAGDIKKFLA
uniref:Alpha-1 2-Mannosidase n=1 Tax=Rhizophora mucronata TaxID=61149 RepID=A0A2P2LVW9_RHIMU